MKAKFIAALTGAIFASAATASADDTTTKANTTPPSSTATSQPSTPSTGAGQTMSPSTGQPTTASAVTTQSTATSTTTTTAADVAEPVTPVAPMTPPTRETVTLYDKHRPNKPLLITGSMIFLGTYATTAAIVGANTDANDKSMYIPVVGPWLALKDADFDTSKTLLYGASGVLQGVGVGLGILSFFIPEKTAAVTIQAKNVKMNVLPAASPGGAGVGAVGTF